MKSADGEAGFHHASRWRDEPEAAEHSVKPIALASELESLVSNADEVRSKTYVQVEENVPKEVRSTIQRGSIREVPL